MPNRIMLYDSANSIEIVILSDPAMPKEMMSSYVSLQCSRPAMPKEVMSSCVTPQCLRCDVIL